MRHPTGTVGFGSLGSFHSPPTVPLPSPGAQRFPQLLNLPLSGAAAPLGDGYVCMCVLRRYFPSGKKTLTRKSWKEGPAQKLSCLVHRDILSDPLKVSVSLSQPVRVRVRPSNRRPRGNHEIVLDAIDGDVGTRLRPRPCRHDEVDGPTRSLPQAFKPILSCHSIWLGCSWRGTVSLRSFMTFLGSRRSLTPECQPASPSERRNARRALKRAFAVPSFYLTHYIPLVLRFVGAFVRSFALA